MDVDKEARSVEAQDNVLVHEDTISLRSKVSFLVSWFVLNLVLTMSNKFVLARVPVPWLLTTFHACSTSAGCIGLVVSGRLKLTRLPSRQTLILGIFSILFTANIAISNLSLSMVSVPMHQVLRSIVPVVTVAIYRMLGRTYVRATYLSLALQILGVAIATRGDRYCTAFGLTITMFGVVLAATKTMVTNWLLTGSLSLSALEVLLRMSPLAAVQCGVVSWAAGEVQQAYDAYEQGLLDRSLLAMLAANGIVALALNIVSFQANKITGALTMTVAGNIKQAVTILIGTLTFGVATSVMNAGGIAVTLVGAAWYSKIEIERKSASTE